MQQINVLGTELIPCSMDPLTGYYRTGCCENHGDDPGMHVICCRVTAAFLEFSASCGNDLSTPAPQYGFAGLKPGDQCVSVRHVGQKLLRRGRPAKWCLRALMSPHSNTWILLISEPTPSPPSRSEQSRSVAVQFFGGRKDSGNPDGSTGIPNTC
jgi:uncharacterized protein (DUF2237 family)